MFTVFLVATALSMKRQTMKASGGLANVRAKARWRGRKELVSPVCGRTI
jgi:hypothetical protein